jgi:hypothetical protein
MKSYIVSYTGHRRHSKRGDKGMAQCKRRQWELGMKDGLYRQRSERGV